MKWIEKIISIDNYTIETLWNDGVVRNIDLEEFLREKTKSPNTSYQNILDKKVFATAKCDSTTIFWENQINCLEIDGTIKKGNLDIAPEVLFEIAENVFHKAV